MTRRGAKKQQHSTPRSLIELVLIVAVALGLAVGIQAVVVKPFRIPSESMVPTLKIGQRVLVNRIDGRFGTPERGDVTVFRPPIGAEENRCGLADGQEFLPGRKYVATETASLDGGKSGKTPCPLPAKGRSDQYFVKRVIGLPGDRLKIVDGHAYINGKRLLEPYLNSALPCRGEVDDHCTFSSEIVVPPDHYFMMGDNRAASDDSRFWGPVPHAYIVGEAFMTYWPPKSVGPL